MDKKRLYFYLRLVAIALWALSWCALFVWSQHSHLDWRHVPHALRLVLWRAGLWGPMIILAAFALRPFLFIPGSGIELAVGSFYGPIVGTFLNIIGESLSATFAFAVGRALGRDFLSRHENGWLKFYDDALTKDGFSAIAVMRLLFLPFDVVSYGAGMTGISFADYIVATFLGLLPGTIAFTVAGDWLGRPSALFVFLGLAAVILALVFAVKLHPRARALTHKPDHD